MRRVVVMLAMLAPLSMAACGWAEWPPPGSGPSTASRPSGSSEARSLQPPPPPPAARREDAMPAVPAPQVQEATLPPPGAGSPAAPAPQPGPPPPASPAAADASTRTITVRPGETIYSLAQRHDVSTRTIIQLNRLSPPYELRTGQRLALPAGDAREHVVRAGDTAYSVAQGYGVDLQALASANGLIAPYRIREGQVLTIPSASRATAAAASEPAAPPAAPPDSRDEATPPAATATAQARQAREKAASAPGGEAAGPSETKTATVEPAAPLPTPPPINGKSFIWPVEGKVISTFGSKDKGNRNDGINIAASRGTTVRAAETGVVAYAGNELRGFGNLVLIRHADGWITAYAHNDELLVSRGATVEKGQEIARVGTSGGVDQPQLHFQVRQGKEAVDPRQYLPANSS